MPRTSSEFMHIVLSTKEQQDPEILLKYLIKSCKNYILAIEKGTTGHPHLECYAHFKKIVSNDVVKRAICNLYPEIPNSERKNVSVTVNHIDDNPAYGYGYSLKEGEIYASTFDEFEHAEFTEYYEKHKDKVNKAKLAAKANKPKVLSELDMIVNEIVDFISHYFELDDDKKFDENSNINWLVEEYFIYLIKEKRLVFSLYQKINREKLEEFCRLSLRTNLLTVRSTKSTHPPPPEPPMTFADDLP